MSEVYQRRISQLERQQEGGRKQIEFAAMARRLADNPDFRKLILDEFMVQECARYTYASSDPALPQENRADSLALAQAAGHLKRWLNVQIQMGDAAESQIQALEEAIEEERRLEASEGVDE